MPAGTNSSASVVTSVNDQATNVTLVAARADRRELIIQNDSPSTLYAKFGTTATSSDYTVKLAQNEILSTTYQGKVDGIWSADASGAAKVTELLP